MLMGISGLPAVTRASSMLLAWATSAQRITAHEQVK
jgi:hypothetical protein